MPDERIESVITGFDLYCTNDDGYGTWMESVDSSNLTFRRTGVEEYTVYTCCVAAVSNNRTGEDRCVDVTTNQAGRLTSI